MYAKEDDESQAEGEREEPFPARQWKYAKHGSENTCRRHYYSIDVCLPLLCIGIFEDPHVPDRDFLAREDALLF